MFVTEEKHGGYLFGHLQVGRVPLENHVFIDHEHHSTIKMEAEC